MTVLYLEALAAIAVLLSSLSRTESNDPGDFRSPAILAGKRHIIGHG
jgi:hypothetical protein